ncbi:PREDICTED: nucleoplasmin-2, partial [Acanthisitta chloris]|uniref:nucleoplasmin-2 n=1 Tax=Acanthisitta chloris TaxID=57068 RepID=UPI0004F0F570
CELSRHKSFYTFEVVEDWHCEQQLALRTICLGETAEDEFHVVEMMSEEGDAQSAVPLATLKPSVLPMTALVGMELPPPVTFHLRTGSGPIYISGQHYSMMNDLSWEEEEAEEEEEEQEEEEEMEEENAEEEEPAEESPKKPPKGQSGRKGSVAK